jgi:hypothetical protein
MTPLFLSQACDHCDGFRTDIHYDRGFIVWTGRPAGAPDYVFRTRRDAERWVQLTGVDGRVRQVLTEDRFRWMESRGSVRGVELADHLFEIFPDHRHQPGPYRAFIA